MIRLALRFIKINFILWRYGLGEFFYALPLLRPIAWFRFLNPWRWFGLSKMSRGQRLRRALERLGPLFIKFGQIVSTRYDAVPQDILVELAKLRDQVPPFSGKRATLLLENEYDVAIETVFQSFNQKAIASASVAQVHEATLPNGRHVAVKILRPNIEKHIARDLRLLRLMAKSMQLFWHGARQLKPVEMIKEIETHLSKEVDLLIEAKNAATLASKMANVQRILIPKIHWEYTTSKVLVTDFIEGISIDKTSQLREAGVDLKTLSQTALTIFFTQMLRDRYFHADLHPGNILVIPTQPPTLGLVDFGIVGELSERDQYYVATVLLAIVKRNYLRVARLHVEAGWVPDTVSVEAFALAMREVCDPMFDQPIKDISMGLLVMRLIQAARTFDIQIQPQLLLLQKTLLNIEGLCRRLDPELNLWEAIKPMIERWVKQQVGPRALLTKIKQELPYWIEQIPQAPQHFLNRFSEQPATPPPDTVKSTAYQRSTLVLLILVAIGINFTAFPVAIMNTALFLCILLIMMTLF